MELVFWAGAHATALTISQIHELEKEPEAWLWALVSSHLRAHTVTDCRGTSLCGAEAAQTSSRFRIVRPLCGSSETRVCR